MSTLNYLCEYDDSDDDCYKCAKRGYIFWCPPNCEYFKDGRERLTKEQKELRAKLMTELGRTDKLPWE